MKKTNYSDISKPIEKYAKKSLENFGIDPTLYTTLQVKRGLRDLDGRGVLTGLTEISEVNAYKKIDGKLIPCEGELYYRGVPVRDLVQGFTDENRLKYSTVMSILNRGVLNASVSNVIALCAALPHFAQSCYVCIIAAFY